MNLSYCLIALGFLAIGSLSADVGSFVLKKYKNPVFVALGIRGGLNIARAMEARFNTIIGIDNDPLFVEHVQLILPRFVKQYRFQPSKIRFICGEPKNKIKDLFFKTDQKITILLSTYLHHCHDESTYNDVIEQINQIGKYARQKPIVLVDYINYEGTSRYGYVKIQDIKEALLHVNKSYRFTFEKGGCMGRQKNGVLVAY